MLLKTPNFAVGILYFLHKFFVKIFEPSSCEETRSGPNTFILFCVKKSTIPSTSGFSGPTIIMSIPSSLITLFNFSKLFSSISIFSAIKLVPAFPGKQ